MNGLIYTRGFFMFNIKKEIEFWTEIMSDHASFQYDNLSPDEKEEIEKATYFIDVFSQLNAEVKSLPDNSSTLELDRLIFKNIEELKHFIKFKEYLLARITQCNIKLGLSPSFINHMINEGIEYLNVLALARQGAPINKTLENIRLHTIWLRDASGHAASISTSLDSTESILIETSDKFKKRFDSMSIKAFELYPMYNRTGLKNGIIEHFNQRVEKEITSFINFLDSIRLLRISCKVLGVLQPIMPYHMIREEKYYLNRIKELAEEA